MDIVNKQWMDVQEFGSRSAAGKNYHRCIGITGDCYSSCSIIVKLHFSGKSMPEMTVSISFSIEY